MRPLTDDREILTQAILLRLQTRRGTYWTDPEYGLALTELLSEHLTASELARLPSRVQAELEKDERIASVAVEVEPSGPLNARRVVLRMTVTPAAGPTFPLVLSVDQVSVEVLTKGAG